MKVSRVVETLFDLRLLYTKSKHFGSELKRPLLKTTRKTV